MTHPPADRPVILCHAIASHAAGFGHVARLCALIEEIDAAGAEPIALFGGDAQLAAWLTARGITADVRAYRPADILAAAASPRVRAVVIDGPALADELAPILVERGCRTVLIDDRGHCPLPVDAIINHNYHAPSLVGTYPAASLCLLGRKYLMLRRDIRRYAHGSCRPRDRGRLRVVLSFGGSDPAGATVRTIRNLPTDRPIDAIAIAGPGFRDHDALAAAAIAAGSAGHTIDIVRDPDDPAALFVASDAAICSAGGTLGELAYLGCPAISFAIVDDQLAPAATQAAAGLISGGQPLRSLSDHALRDQLTRFLADSTLRRDQRDRALATADASGPRRIVAEALS